MATYVTSDAHGHLRALDRVLEASGVGADDTLYVLGDMIDRGPEPLGVIHLVRGLADSHGIGQVHVLKGNHEGLMLDALQGATPYSEGDWEINGGWVTAGQLDALPREQADDIIAWMRGLPLYDVVKVEDRFAPRLRPASDVAPASGAAPTCMRTYMLCHAGINAPAAHAYLAASGIPVERPGVLQNLDVSVLYVMMGAQKTEDLLWIREEFWGRPTGFVDGEGRGPLVVAGHTPSVLIQRYAGHTHGPVLNADERALVVEVGACQDTGGVADRIDIDASAAGGAPHGQVAVMRLEDHRVWYAPVEEGE